MSKYDLKKIEEDVIGQIKHVFDPEIPVNIFDLGLIYDIKFEEKNEKLDCKITMTLTNPGCPVAGDLVSEVKYAVGTLDIFNDINVEITFTPMWTKNFVSQEGQDILMMHGFVL